MKLAKRKFTLSKSSVVCLQLILCVSLIFFDILIYFLLLSIVVILQKFDEEYSSKSSGNSRKALNTNKNASESLVESKSEVITANPEKKVSFHEPSSSNSQNKPSKGSLLSGSVKNPLASKIIQKTQNENFFLWAQRFGLPQQINEVFIFLLFRYFPLFTLNIRIYLFGTILQTLFQFCWTLFLS